MSLRVVKLRKILRVSSSSSLSDVACLCFVECTEMFATWTKLKPHYNQDVADALDVSDDFVAPLQNACLELGWRTSVR